MIKILVLSQDAATSFLALLEQAGIEGRAVHLQPGDLFTYLSHMNITYAVFVEQSAGALAIEADEQAVAKAGKSNLVLLARREGRYQQLVFWQKDKERLLTAVKELGYPFVLTRIDDEVCEIFVQEKYAVDVLVAVREASAGT